MRALALMLAQQRGHLFEWVPVMLALGISVYFSLRFEPSVTALASAGGAGAVLVFLGLRYGAGFGPLLVALGLVALGLALAGGRAHWVSGPVLEHRYYGAVTGRVVALDRSASDKLRIVLDRVVLERMAPGATPDRVRLSLHEVESGMTRFVPGQVVMTTAHLSPPQGPVEPGGFDFQRHAWFKRLGAVGYTRVPVLLWQAPEGGASLFVARARLAMSAWVQAHLEGRVGRFAAALMTGDRSGMDVQTLTDLRRTNLAHLLAISGLHMGLLTGFVFAAIRLGLSAIPALALRVPIKKIAALGALLAGAGYLALSGASVATERAFVMVAMMFLAVVFDQRAISLRAIALAALIVLLMRPESLLSPGFQMSFAATTALVAAFSLSRDLPAFRWPKWLRWIGALVLSSAVAGAATAPFAAAHFNMFASYGLVANLASVPLMGTVVMPGAVVAVLLAPLGLEDVGFFMVGAGLDWILRVAHHVAVLDGAVRYIPAPSALCLPLIALGGLFAILWQGRARALGLAPVAVALVVWTMTPRPGVLIAEGAALVGVQGGDGRALSRSRGAGFTARVWLENDGDGAVQSTAFSRGAGDVLTYEGTRIRHVTGKRAREGGADLCTGVDILVLAAKVPQGAAWPCDVFDHTRLKETGAVSGAILDGKLTLTTVSERRGPRLWARQLRAR